MSTLETGNGRDRRTDTRDMLIGFRRKDRNFENLKALTAMRPLILAIRIHSWSMQGTNCLRVSLDSSHHSITENNQVNYTEQLTAYYIMYGICSSFTRRVGSFHRTNPLLHNKLVLNAQCKVSVTRPVRFPAPCQSQAYFNGQFAEAIICYIEKCHHIVIFVVFFFIISMGFNSLRNNLIK